MTDKTGVRVLFYRGAETWIAQCVEYDIAAFSTSLEELPRAFERAVAANVCANHDLGREGLEGIAPAPQAYEKLADSSPFRLEPRITKFAIKHSLPIRVREVVFAEKEPAAAA